MVSVWYYTVYDSEREMGALHAIEMDATRRHFRRLGSGT